jgi:hypothetical protein
MYVNFETTFDAIRAEQQVAHLCATKLGPLLAEVEREPLATPAVTVNAAGLLSSPIVAWLRHKLRASRLKWTQQASGLRPSVEQ